MFVLNDVCDFESQNFIYDCCDAENAKHSQAPSERYRMRT